MRVQRIKYKIEKRMGKYPFSGTLALLELDYMNKVAEFSKLDELFHGYGELFDKTFNEGASLLNNNLYLIDKAHKEECLKIERELNETTFDRIKRKIIGIFAD